MQLLAPLAALLSLVFAPAEPVAPVESKPVQPEPLVLEMPANGTITDDYGPRWGRMHRGIDVGILRSLPVKAAAAGKVTQTGYLTGYAGYGNVVLVDVGGGYTTMYAHLARIDVRRGESVVAGAPLGLAGCTGSCTGTHLHFELHKSGAAIDPMPFFAR